MSTEPSWLGHRLREEIISDLASAERDMRPFVLAVKAAKREYRSNPTPRTMAALLKAERDSEPSRARVREIQAELSSLNARNSRRQNFDHFAHQARVRSLVMAARELMWADQNGDDDDSFSRKCDALYEAVDALWYMEIREETGAGCANDTAQAGGRSE